MSAGADLLVTVGLENGGVRDERTRSRDELIADFVQFYSGNGIVSEEQ